MKNSISLLPILIAVFFVNLADGVEKSQRPNIIFIMADDQGYADLKCYGSKQQISPAMDQLAAEGLRFTNCYSGSSVCGPSRCVLMTGLHPGHCRRRDNTAKAHHSDFADRPLVPLAKDDLTVATVLQKAGYVTGGFGKWGLGNPGTTGEPSKHGFDHFFGYLDQVHAHDYYTDKLWKDDQYVPLVGNEGKKKETYSHDVIADAALDFIRKYQDRPFFLYLPYTPPHGDYVVPDNSLYANKPWKEMVKNYAAMITRMDGDIAEMMALLKELNLDENTIVFYTSDNGPNQQFLKDLDSNGPLRGVKRQSYEGGIRCPMIVRWPGKIKPGSESDYAWTHKDFFATACELAGVAVPSGLDSISVLPTLQGKQQPVQKFLYWEMHSPFHQAVRMGNWKAIRWGTEVPMELYDLNSDLGEENNVAAKHPDIVKQMANVMLQQRTENKYWPAIANSRANKKKKQ
ncbi:MAG: N-acetylgalactosamine-6-sulfatase [Blastopirellula sp.]|nr:MAG: N-acetylgalactosamine-6-sulfatase [Blastopirellula sp.]